MHADGLHTALLNASVSHSIKLLYCFGLQIEVFEIKDFMKNPNRNCHAYLEIGHKSLMLYVI